ncbi:MAG: hypothetical protein IKN91_06325 [Paludibacteraceae bacterium]|nr:hypothetical protein [Paludibacteraceae bacterium]
MKTNLLNAISKIRYLAMLMVLTLISTNAWGTLPASPTWTATALSSIPDGSTIIILSNSTAANNVALPSTTTGSNPARKVCTISTTAGVTTITPPSGTTLQSLAWTLKKSGSNYKFYQEGSADVRLFLNGTGSNTALRVGNASSTNDEFVMGSGGKLLKVSTANRFVGPYESGSDWRTYNSETATNYKSAALTFYVLNATSTCANKVTLTKAAATNGSFALKEGSASGTEIASGGTVDNCDANAIVYIVPTPNTGYKVNGTPTATNSASVTADGSNFKITYTKGASKASTVTVSFTAQSYTVTLNKNGGTGGTASVTATYNATCPAIGGAVPTKTGYDFTGYYSGSGGTGTKVVNADLTWVATASGYTSSSKWVKAATTTLYAGWAPKSYTVTWKVNGVAYTSTSVNHGEHVTTLPTDPSPASYCGDKFMGWTTVENYDAGTAPSPLFTTASEAPTASGNQVFYAVFGYY